MSVRSSRRQSDLNMLPAYARWGYVTFFAAHIFITILVDIQALTIADHFPESLKAIKQVRHILGFGCEACLCVTLCHLCSIVINSSPFSTRAGLTVLREQCTRDPAERNPSGGVFPLFDLSHTSGFLRFSLSRAPDTEVIAPAVGAS